MIVRVGASADQVKKLENQARAVLDLEADTPKEEKDVRNVLQAIAFNRERFIHGTPQEQAVALCWLLHTLGDIHQPLHTTTAFSVHALDPNNEKRHHGDEGGNRIHLTEKGKKRKNLHDLWDGAPDLKFEAMHKGHDQSYV